MEKVSDQGIVVVKKTIFIRLLTVALGAAALYGAVWYGASQYMRASAWKKIQTQYRFLWESAQDEEKVPLLSSIEKDQLNVMGFPLWPSFRIHNISLNKRFFEGLKDSGGVFSFSPRSFWDSQVDCEARFNVWGQEGQTLTLYWKGLSPARTQKITPKTSLVDIVLLLLHNTSSWDLKTNLGDISLEGNAQSSTESFQFHLRVAQKQGDDVIRSKYTVMASPASSRPIRFTNDFSTHIKHYAAKTLGALLEKLLPLFQKNLDPQIAKHLNNLVAFLKDDSWAFMKPFLPLEVTAEGFSEFPEASGKDVKALWHCREKCATSLHLEEIIPALIDCHKKYGKVLTTETIRIHTAEKSSLFADITMQSQPEKDGHCSFQVELRLREEDFLKTLAASRDETLTKWLKVLQAVGTVINHPEHKEGFMVKINFSLNKKGIDTFLVNGETLQSLFMKLLANPELMAFFMQQKF